MKPLAEALEIWRNSLCQELLAGGLFSRDPEVHRWKAFHRSAILREATSWRAHDLLTQAVYLSEAQHLLGARILVRSALETLCVLAYLNQITWDVVKGKLTFKEFSDKTIRLTLGSKDGSTRAESINIVTVLKRVEDRVPGITDVYASLSESAHPNYEGTVSGYGTVDHENYATKFSNKWAASYASGFESYVRTTGHLYQVEYDSEWIRAWEALENWVRENPGKMPVTPPDA